MDSYHFYYNRSLRYARREPLPAAAVHKGLHGTETLNFLQHLQENHPSEEVATASRQLLRLPGYAGMSNLHDVLSRHAPELHQFINPNHLGAYFLSTPSADERSPAEVDRRFFKDYDPSKIQHDASHNDWRPDETIPEDFYS